MTTTARKLTKAAAKQIRSESLELLKTAKQQVSQEGISDVQPQDTNSSEVKITPEEEAKIKNESRRRLGQLEEEMEQYRRLRKQRDQEIEEQRLLEEKQALQEVADQQEPLATGSKPKRGVAGMAGKIKKLQKGPEARAGKGKS